MGTIIIKLGSVVIVLVLFAAVFYAGYFVQSFDNNLCYTNVINIIKEQYVEVEKSHDAAVRDKFSGLLKSLPLRGYESDCDEILEAATEHAK